MPPTQKKNYLHVIPLAIYWLQSRIVFAFWSIIRLIPLKVATDIVASIVRSLGPLLPRHRTGMSNLALAFPEKTIAERRRILSLMWDNLARTAIEYIYLDTLIDFDPDNPSDGNIEVIGSEVFDKLVTHGKPCIIFTGHLANWELLPVCAKIYGLDISALYRMPNNPFIARRILEIRSQVMGDLIASGPFAAYQLMAVLDKGGRIGVLVDQKFRSRSRLMIPFFGHDATTNPLIGKLAREYDCPVHGARVIRLPEGRFRFEITDEISLPRDSDGRIDTKGTVTTITQIMEDWIREHPEQWLWIHRRWAS